MDAKKPYEIVQELYAIRSTWTDNEILAELESLPVVPDEYIDFDLYNPAWDDDQVMAKLYIYLALEDLISERKLRAGVPLLLTRACYGDMGETMRGLPGIFRSAFEDDFEALAEVYIQAAKYPQKGARLWAIDDLGWLLRFEHISNRRALRTLIEGLNDTARLVRSEALYKLEVCAELPDYRSIIIPALEEFLLEKQDTLKRVQELLGNIQTLDTP